MNCHRGCSRCNQSPAALVTHGANRRYLCERCVRIVGANVIDDVRSGVDFLIHTGNAPAIGAVMDIVRAAAEVAR